MARGARHQDWTSFSLLRRGTIRSSKNMLENGVEPIWAGKILVRQYCHICMMCIRALYFYTYKYRKMKMEGGRETRKFVDCTVTKKVIVFPFPSRDVTNQTLPGLEYFHFSRTGRLWLVTSRLGTGKL